MPAKEIYKQVVKQTGQEDQRGVAGGHIFTCSLFPFLFHLVFSKMLVQGKLSPDSPATACSLWRGLK